MPLLYTSQVLLEDNRATGVEYMQDGVKQIARLEAGGEVNHLTRKGSNKKTTIADGVFTSIGTTKASDKPVPCKMCHQSNLPY